MVAAVGVGDLARPAAVVGDEATVDDEYAELDRDDLDRAAGEGMGTAPGASERRSTIPRPARACWPRSKSHAQTTEPDAPDRRDGATASATDVGDLGVPVVRNGVGVTSDRNV